MMHSLLVKNLLKWMLVVAMMGILAWLSTHLADPAVQQVDDFVEYWAASHLHLAGDNPYSPAQMFALQQSVGWPEADPLMMWNPPWSLVFVMPFGLLGYAAGRVLWLLLNLFLVVLCADWLWRFYGGPIRRRWLAWGVGLTFVPVILALDRGQISPLILVGVVAFLHFEKRRNWWLAGAATLLIAIKPHLLYLFWIALLLWVWDQRRWSVLLGSGLAGVTAMAISLSINPAMMGQYLHTATSQPPFQYATPTFGTLLRLLFGLGRAWLQFVPSLIGALWLVRYWRSHRHAWRWDEQMSLLALASVITTSFGWEFDQVVLLPAVIQGAVWIFQGRRHLTVDLVILAYVLINGLALAMRILRLYDFWFIWMAPTLLLSYLVLQQQSSWDMPTGSTHSDHAVIPGTWGATT